MRARFARILLPLACVGAVVSAWALFALSRRGSADNRRSAAPAWALGSLAWNQDLIPDVGAVCAGATIERQFALTNVGSRALQIHQIDPGCGECSQVSADRYRIEPGEAVNVNLSVKTPDNVPYEEKQQYRSSIYFLGQREPIVVGLRCTIFREFPLVVDFGRVLLSDVHENAFLARGCDGAAPQILKVTPEDDRVALDFETLTAPASALRGRVTFRPADPCGPFVARIRVDYASPEPREAWINVRGTVVPELEPTPAVLSLGVMRSGEVASRAVELSSLDGKPFEILGLQCESRFSLTSVPVDEQHLKQRVQVDFTADAAAHNWPVVLTVTTNHPRRASVAIPIYGFVRAEETVVNTQR